jgi:methylmalonyl-CoA mutase N-terminal domain/subunit
MGDRIEELIRRIEARGGMIKSIKEGFIQKEILEEAYKKEKQMRTGEAVVVGVNRFTIEEEEKELRVHEYNAQVAKEQVESLNHLRKTRDKEKVKRHKERLRTAGRNNENLMPYLIEAFKDYVSLGEVCQVFKEEFGIFEQPPVI